MAFRSGNAATPSLGDLDFSCVESICQFLHPNDLAAFSRTCSRYKFWSEQYFRRKGCPGEIEISAKDIGVDFSFQNAEEFEIRFRSIIGRSRLQLSNSNVVEILKFLSNNCTKYVTQLRLLNAGDEEYVNLTESHSFIIAEQLKCVRTLELCGIDLKDIYNNLLKYCTNLQTLFISPYGGLHMGLEHLEKSLTSHRFFKLEIFVFVDYHQNSTKNIDFSLFQSNHPTLKAVVTNQISFIKSLCMTENHLRYVAMVFHSEIDVLENWCLLEICFMRKFIKSLELVVSAELSYGTVKSILNFPLVDAIHWYFSNPFINLKTHKHIRKLSALLYSNRSDSVTSQIIQCFPCLQTLWIFTDCNLRQMLLPLIGKIGTLKHLYIRSLTAAPLTINLNDIVDLNMERLKGNHTTPVTVHLHKEALEVKEELLCSIPEDSLVKVKVCGNNLASKIPFYFNDFKTSMAYLNEVVYGNC